MKWASPRGSGDMPAFLGAMQLTVMCFVLAASSDFVASYYISLGDTLAKRLTNHRVGNFH